MKSPCVLHGVTSIGNDFNLSQGIDRPCGENAADTIHPPKKKKSLREVTAYSAVCPERVRATGQKKSWSSRQLRSRWKKTFGSMPRGFRKACCLPLPPRLLAASYSCRQCSTSVRRSRTSRCPAPLRRVPQSVLVQTGFELGSTPLQAPRSCSFAVVRCVFPRSTRILRLREIWAQDSRSHIAMSYRPSIAWKASLRAHRRRFARPLRVLKPRWS